MVLSVRDDGEGIGPEPPGRDYGLRNMAERATRLGGHCSVGSVDGWGTLVEWRVPVEGG